MLRGGVEAATLRSSAHQSKTGTANNHQFVFDETAALRSSRQHVLAIGYGQVEAAETFGPSVRRFDETQPGVLERNLWPACRITFDRNLGDFAPALCKRLGRRALHLCGQYG